MNTGTIMIRNLHKKDSLIFKNTPFFFLQMNKTKEDKLATILDKEAKERSEMLEIYEQKDLLIRNAAETLLD